VTVKQVLGFLFLQTLRAEERTVMAWTQSMRGEVGTQWNRGDSGDARACLWGSREVKSKSGLEKSKVHALSVLVVHSPNHEKVPFYLTWFPERCQSLPSATGSKQRLFSEINLQEFTRHLRSLCPRRNQGWRMRWCTGTFQKSQNNVPQQFLHQIPPRIQPWTSPQIDSSCSVPALCSQCQQHSPS